MYINTIVRCYNEDLEKYGLVNNFRSFEGVLPKIEEILTNFNYKKIYSERQRVMLKNKIDVTSFILWFIENYPNSAQTMSANPDHQNSIHLRYDFFLWILRSNNIFVY